MQVPKDGMDLLHNARNALVLIGHSIARIFQNVVRQLKNDGGKPTWRTTGHTLPTIV